MLLSIIIIDQLSLIPNVTNVTRDYTSRNQFGFEKKSDTKNATRVIQMLNERCIGNCSDPFSMFVDLEKDSYRVHWKTLLNNLK